MNDVVSALIAEDADITAIREGVRAVCAQFPGDYWQETDRERAYPTEFVNALTEAGYLAALIPEEYGGSGLGMRPTAAIMEEIQKSGCNGGGCHAQMYIMGTILRHGNDEQKKSTYRESPVVNYGFKLLVSLNPPAAPIR